MGSELDSLAAVAEELAGVLGPGDGVTAGGGVVARVRRLGERLGGGRFHVSVLGEFKRGKSTLVNVLLGTELLPVGVVPVTAVATEVSFGDPGATVVGRDGSRREIGLDELALFVTEAGNPGNERGVVRVEVRDRVDLLAPGVVLVDTPGLGSIYRHADVAAHRALLDADGAIVVLSADTPVSEQERALLATLAGRQAPTFFVVNKIDHVVGSDREELRRFVERVVADELGRQERVWCVAARAGLAARPDGREPTSEEAGELAGFVAAFRSFVEADLVEARLVTARRELARLAREVEESLRLEAAAASLEAGVLAARVARFEKAADEQRQVFADERTLLARDVAALSERIGADLFAFARGAPASWLPRLEEVGGSAPVARLGDALREMIAAAVREDFERFRTDEADFAEVSWRRLAERFRSRTQARVNAVRAEAAGLFDVEMPEAVVPAVSEEQERFFYLFLHVGMTTDALGRVLRRLLPRAVVRRRVVERARVELAGEFDKHAGRVRWDLTQRLDGVRRRFEAAMAAELDQTIAAILAAARRAEQLRRSGAADQQHQQRRRDVVGAAARRALDAAGAVDEPATGAEPDGRVAGGHVRSGRPDDQG